MASAQASEGAANPLVTTLVSQSSEAITWLTDHFKIDLSVLSQLGGHSYTWASAVLPKR